jgi:hypothetical protein
MGAAMVPSGLGLIFGVKAEMRARLIVVGIVNFYCYVIYVC